MSPLCKFLAQVSCIRNSRVCHRYKLDFVFL